MAFEFDGFFTNCQDSNLIEDIKNELPFCLIDNVYHPFLGIEVRSPDINESVPLKEKTYNEIINTMDSIEEKVQILSKKYNELFFIYVDATCFGGTCIYNGMVIKNGKIIYKDQNDKLKGEGCLKYLFNYFDIILDDNEYFLPFAKRK